MPYRAMVVTTRHHPVAVGCYLGITILAVLYLLDVASAASLTAETSGTWAMVWQISLLVGGLLALGGTWAPKRHLITGLGMEALGVMVIGVELAIYVLVMAMTLESTPWASALVFGSVALGCLVRCWTALRDRRRVVAAVLAPHATTVLAEPQ